MNKPYHFGILMSQEFKKIKFLIPVTWGFQNGMTCSCAIFCDLILLLKHCAKSAIDSIQNRSLMSHKSWLLRVLKIGDWWYTKSASYATQNRRLMVYKIRLHESPSMHWRDRRYLLPVENQTYTRILARTTVLCKKTPIKRGDGAVRLIMLLESFCTIQLFAPKS